MSELEGIIERLKKIGGSSKSDIDSTNDTIFWRKNLDKLIVMDEVLRLADRSNDFDSFLTVARKFLLSIFFTSCIQKWPSGGLCCHGQKCIFFLLQSNNRVFCKFYLLIVLEKPQPKFLRTALGLINFFLIWLIKTIKFV